VANADEVSKKAEGRMWLAQRVGYIRCHRTQQQIECEVSKDSREGLTGGGLASDQLIGG